MTPKFRKKNIAYNRRRIWDKNNRHVETSRVIRLWLGQIIIPTVTAVLVVSPEAREWTKTKIDNVVKHIKSKLNKK